MDSSISSQKIGARHTLWWKFYCDPTSFYARERNFLDLLIGFPFTRSKKNKKNLLRGDFVCQSSFARRCYRFTRKRQKKLRKKFWEGRWEIKFLIESFLKVVKVKRTGILEKIFCRSIMAPNNNIPTIQLKAVPITSVPVSSFVLSKLIRKSSEMLRKVPSFASKKQATVTLSEIPPMRKRKF